MRHRRFASLPVLAALFAAGLSATGAHAAGVTLYQHCGFAGYSVKLNGGDFPRRDLVARGMKDNDVSSIRVEPGTQVILFDGDDFHGRSLRLEGDHACLVDLSFNDVLSSLKVVTAQRPNPSPSPVRAQEHPHPGQPPQSARSSGAGNARLTVYQHCGYAGYRVELPPGDYQRADLERMGIRNDDLSSLQVAPNTRVELFSGERFDGKRLQPQGNIDCLVNVGFNDVVSSIRVADLGAAQSRQPERHVPTPVSPPPVAASQPGRGPATSARVAVFQHCGYQGYRVELPPGDYRRGDLERLGILNDDLSSIQIAPNTRVELFSGDQFDGRRLEPGSDIGCLVSYQFNDVVSSIRVFDLGAASQASGPGPSAPQPPSPPPYTPPPTQVSTNLPQPGPASPPVAPGPETVYQPAPGGFQPSARPGSATGDRQPGDGVNLAVLMVSPQGNPPLYAPDMADHLAIGPEVTISMLFRPEWDDGWCEAERSQQGRNWNGGFKTLYSNASASSSRFAVALDCERRSLRIVGGGRSDQLMLPPDIRRNEVHHLVLQIDAEGTQVWIDAQPIGAVPVSYGDTRRVPVQIGSDVNGYDAFVGTIAALRVWNGKVSPEALQASCQTPVAGLDGDPLSDRLVGYMQTDSAGRLAFVTRQASPDPSGRWLAFSAVNTPQIEHKGRSNTDRTIFSPEEVTTVTWTEACSPLARQGGVQGNGSDCGARWLAVYVSRLWSAPYLALYRPLGGGRFASLNGTGELLVYRDRDREVLEVNGKRLSRPGSFVDDGSFTGSFAGQFPSYDRIGYAYHQDDLNLRFADLTPRRSVIFAVLPEDVGHNFRRIGEIATPAGLAVIDEVHCHGESDTRTINNGVALAEEMESLYASTRSQASRISAGLDLGGKASVGGSVSWTEALGENLDLKTKTNEMNASETMLVRETTACTKKVFYLDPGRLQLSRNFIDEVERLRQIYTGGGGEAAVQDFLQRVGTHYANAMVFGAVASADIQVSKQEWSSATAFARTQGESTEHMIGAQMEAKLSTPRGGGSVGGGHSSTTGESQSDMSGAERTAFGSQIRSKTFWDSRGGTGSASQGNWNAEGSQVPVYMQLRPIHELLGPPFFTDPDIVFTLREAVRLALGNRQVRMADGLKPFIDHPPPICPAGMNFANGICIGQPRVIEIAAIPPECTWENYTFDGTAGCMLAGPAMSKQAQCPSGYDNTGSACVPKDAGKTILHIVDTSKWKYTGCDLATCEVNYERKGCSCQQMPRLGRETLRCPAGKTLKFEGRKAYCDPGCPAGKQPTGNNQCQSPGERATPECPTQFRFDGRQCNWIASQ